MKHKIIFSLVCILLLSISTSSFNSFNAFGTTTTSNAEKEAIRLWHHYESASMTDSQLLNEVQKSLKKYPIDQYKSSIELIAIGGLCSLNLKKYKEAEAAGLQVVKHSSKYLMGPYLVGSAQIGLQQYATAEKQLQKAIGIDKYFAGTYVSLGELKIKTRKYNEAAKFYVQSTMPNPHLNAASIQGYKSNLEYINPMLAFKLKLAKKDTLMGSSEFITLAKSTYQSDPEELLKKP